MLLLHGQSGKLVRQLVTVNNKGDSQVTVRKLSRLNVINKFNILRYLKKYIKIKIEDHLHKVRISNFLCNKCL